jgi:hypothetical protein
MRRILLAGLVGGIVVFAWSAFSHMVLYVGEQGMRSLPNEDVVRATLHASIPEPGMYYFPGMDPRDKSKAAQDAWAAKYRTGPAGLLIYLPVGGELPFGRMMGVELLSDILAAAIAAFAIARLRAGYLRRAVTVGALGLFAWLSISVSNWNWYGFPGSYILSEGLDQVVGWFLGGLAMARLAVAREAA